MRLGRDEIVRAGGATVTVRIIYVSEWDIRKLTDKPDAYDRRLRAWADRFYSLADGDVFLVFLPEPPAAPEPVGVIHDSPPDSPTIGWTYAQQEAAIREATNLRLPSLCGGAG